MKIDAKKFREYLTKVTMNSSIDMIVLNFTADGAMVRAKTLDNAGAGMGLLKNTAFQEYEAVGEVGIKNVRRVMDMLKTMSGVITVSLQGNKFVMSNDSQVWSITTAKKDYIANHMEAEFNAPFDGGVNIKSAVLKSALNNKSIVSGDFIILECKDKILSVFTGEDSSDSGVIKEECDYKNFKAKFGSVIDSTIGVLGDNINMAGGDDYPIKFTETTEDYMIRLYIAPITDDKVEDVKSNTETTETVQPTSEPTETKSTEAPATPQPAAPVEGQPASV